MDYNLKPDDLKPDLNKAVKVLLSSESYMSAEASEALKVSTRVGTQGSCGCRDL